MLPGRVHERYDQEYRGVPVFGGGVARQLDAGQTVSVFAVLYDKIDVSTVARISPQQAKLTIERLGGAQLGPSRIPALVILPLESGTYALAYSERVATPADVTVYFVDANTGERLLSYSDLKTQAAVGTAVGVLGDTKKISVFQRSGLYTTDDLLRPPVLKTFDMRGDLSRTLGFLNGFVSLGDSDYASDHDNQWTDGAAADAHVYAGWTYDYLYKQFGRKGIDDQNHRIVSLVHPVRREDLLVHSNEVVSLYFLNAVYFGDGVMMFGEGLPESYVRAIDGKRVNYYSGAIDVVAHELAHGLTEFSSNLEYRNEPGALNEAFSDIIATGVEFYFQPPGVGPLKADYLHAEDTVTPGGNRSLADPLAYGLPDHYSRRRYIGSAFDNGGVHINSGLQQNLWVASGSGS